jgi:hypothetical protein
MFLSHCIPEAIEDFNLHLFAYSMPFWNKLIVDEAMSITHSMDHH